MPDTVIWDGTSLDGNIATAGNYVGAAAAASGDTTVFPAMAALATHDVAGADNSAVLQAATFIEAGNYLNFGSRAAYLVMDTDLFDFRGSGSYSFFNIVNCAEMRILNGVSASSGYSYGMSLLSTAVTLLIIDPANGGNESASIGLATMGSEAAEFTTIDIRSGNVTVGTAVTCTTCHISGGTVSYGSDVTTMNVSGGTVRILKNNPTTLNLKGGTVYYNSADVPTTINVYEGGTLVLNEDLRAKTLTINLYGGTVVFAYGQLDGSTVNIKGGGTLQAV